MVLQLLRTYHSNGTNGELIFNGKRICYTIELPWKKNQRRISCIPEGTYTLRRRYTTRFGLHILVQNVPDRDWILIHAFNNALDDSQGCIAPVEKIGGEGIGGPSRPVLSRLMAFLDPFFDKGETIFLIIKKSSNENINCSAGAKADSKVL